MCGVRCVPIIAAWIDYRKAFDSVPRNWLLECLCLFMVSPVLVRCFERLLLLWRTTLFLHLPSAAPQQLATSSIRCGIFQGDTLSPLLFCLSLNPLSYLLDTMERYKISSTIDLTPLMYMDDIKLFPQMIHVCSSWWIQ